MIHSAPTPLQVFRHDCQLNQSVCPNAHVNRTPARLSAVGRGYCHLICQHDGIWRKPFLKANFSSVCRHIYRSKNHTKVTAKLTRIKNKSSQWVFFFNLRARLPNWYHDLIWVLAWYRLQEKLNNEEQATLNISWVLGCIVKNRIASGASGQLRNICQFPHMEIRFL